jgi:hypothetical protein
MDGSDLDEIPDSDDGERELNFARTQPDRPWRLEATPARRSSIIPSTAPAIEANITNVSFLFIYHLS